MSLNDYESVFILPPDYSPQRVDEFIEKIKALLAKHGGEATLIVVKDAHGQTCPTFGDSSLPLWNLLGIDLLLQLER